ncbi:MAG: SMP-30/gluconolactonase/LRE family protein, partial [Cyanobacteria bacterium J06636_27]
MIKNTFRLAKYSLLLGLLNLSSSCGNTHANTSQTSNIVGDNSKVEKLFDGFKFTEGPVWNPEGF